MGSQQFTASQGKGEGKGGLALILSARNEGSLSLFKRNDRKSFDVLSSEDEGLAYGRDDGCNDNALRLNGIDLPLQHNQSSAEAMDFSQ
jgi:hypothetical protein